MPRLHIRTDRDIDRGIQQFAKRHDLTVSQAARELLRQAIGSPAKAIDRGWLEGFAHGHRAYQLELAGRTEGVPPAKQRVRKSA
jgi:hypothetical protein